MEKDSVKVFLRVRPNKAVGLENSPAQMIDLNKSTHRMIIIEKAPYTFDHIFYPTSTQDEVYQNMVEPQVEKLVKGFNSSVLAYGQSGAGKTFTMGLNEQKTAGMIIMGIDSLFAKLPTITNEMKDPEVTVSFIEIYNEKVYDLLSDNSEESIYSKGAKFNGSIKVPITSSAEAYQVIQQGKKNRHVRATKLNGASSRSHAMFSVFLHFRSESSQETLSVMHFCDLAGSEGLRHTNHIGIAQQESVNINRGLLSVSKVVQALSTGKSLIPYRDSVLTVVLQDSLNIRSYITILACISPARGDKSETMSTIRFAQSVKTLDNKNVPELNTYLIEKQYLQARTPLKSYMQPWSQNKTLNTMQKSQTMTGTMKKQPIRRTLYPTSTARKTAVARKTDGLSITTNMSIDTTMTNNNTFSILNCSTSTEIDRPSVAHLASSPIQATNITMPSFSPYMRQFEKTIDTKLEMFMKNLENQTNLTLRTNELQNGFKRNMMSEIYETAAGLTSNFNEDSVMTNSTFDHQQEPPTTSTVVKNLNPSRQFHQTQLIRTELKVTSMDNEIRTVRRTSLESVAVAGNQTFDAQNGSDNIPDQTIVERPRQLRRSVRISGIQRDRFSSFVHEVESKKQLKVRNEPVAFLLSPKNLKKPDQKKAILKLANTGKVNQIKLLPSVGIKTAMQIVTFRSMNGEYKNFDDLHQIPALKGKFWQKFLAANMLT